MNNTKSALEKFFNTMMIIDIPEIEKVVITDDSLDELSPHKRYSIFVGITPENLRNMDTEKMREKIKQYSSYILNSKNEKLVKIVYFNPEEF